MAETPSSTERKAQERKGQERKAGERKVHRSVSGAEARRALARAEGEEVKIVLAHPLKDGNPFTGKAAEPEQEVTLTRNAARGLISAGYAAVDPEDHEAVAKALKLSGGAEEAKAELPGGGSAPGGGAES